MLCLFYFKLLKPGESLGSRFRPIRLLVLQVSLAGDITKFSKTLQNVLSELDFWASGLSLFFSVSNGVNKVS